MKKYYAKKPCRFGNSTYIIGDEIPANEIDPNRVKALVKYGVISEDDVPDEQPAKTQPVIPVAEKTADKEPAPVNKPNAKNKPDEKAGAKGQQGKKVEK